MILLDGRKARDFYTEKLAEKIRKSGFSPHLSIIQVGNNLSSTKYIEQKRKLGEKIGATVDYVKFEENVPFEEIKQLILSLNRDKNIHGIILQLPIPANLDKNSLINSIAPEKDVDGLVEGSRFVPATARGIISLLNFYKIKIKGKKVAVLGRSTLVGKPTAKIFENLGATVTVCHSQTANTREITSIADIIVVAIGKPKFVDETYIGKNFPVVVDVGISSVDGKLFGDVDFEKVSPLVSAITPVPGGVGPMTVISLFENLVEAA